MKQDINELPLDEIYDQYTGLLNSGTSKQDAARLAVTNFSELYKLKNQDHWFPNQVLSYIVNNTTLPRQKDISAYEFLDVNFTTRPKLMGLYLMFTMVPRSTFIGKQLSAIPVCSLVPVFLAAFKKYHSIPYYAWRKDELAAIVEPTLLEAATCHVPYNFSTEELLDFRQRSLAGKPAKSTYGVYHVPEFKGIPQLRRTMLLQTWLAHPDNRTDLMILDPDNWDNMPPPLIDVNVLGEPEVKVTPKKSLGANKHVIPWLQ
jgi:hypothetical protein